VKVSECVHLGQDKATLNEWRLESERVKERKDCLKVVGGKKYQDADGWARARSGVRAHVLASQMSRPLDTKLCWAGVCM
jgi:hypothetical protein